MNEPVKVVITPEKMAELKQKYPDLNDETLQDVLQSIHVTSVKREEPPPAPAPNNELEEEKDLMPQLFRKMQGGEVTMVDYLMWSEMQDRKEERRRRLDREEGGTQDMPKAIAEAVATTVKEALKEALPTKSKTEEEVPSWAKPMIDQQKLITDKLAKEDEEKRLQQTISSAVKPIEEKLAKTEEELKRSKEEAGKAPLKTELETTKETLQTLGEIDKLRGKGEAPLPPGTPGEVTIATKTIDKGEKVLTQGMADIKGTIEQVLEFQLEREKHLYKGQAPELPRATEEEKLKVLKEAAGETVPEEASAGGA